MELHNVLEICCSWKSQKLLHVDASHCLDKFLATLPGILWGHLEVINERVGSNSICQGLQAKQQAGSRTGSVKSVPDSLFEEANVGGHDILHEHLDPAPRKPELQLELNTKQWSVTNIISFNAGKSLIVSKYPSSAPW
jgi:hypothetical protein